MFTHGVPLTFRSGVHIISRQPPSGQSRVYRVTQLNTEDVQCRQSTDTGPVVLKVVPVIDLIDRSLRIENCEQGRLRSNGRTDKLYVGRHTVGGTRGPITPVQSQNLYTLVLILRLICLLLAQFLRIRRDCTIGGT